MLVTGSNVDSNRLPWVTVLLLLVNVAVFVKSYTLEVQAANERQTSGVFGFFVHEETLQNVDLPKTQKLIDFYKSWGFSMEDITERGDVLSLFTHMFTHGGLVHVVGNMLMLWVFGLALEVALKSGRFAVFYGVCGLVAALAQGIYAAGTDIPCIGASGAIAGLMGGFLVLFGTKAKLDVIIYGIFVRVEAMYVCVFWIFTQVTSLMLADPSTGGVAWLAHIGGFAAGAGILAITRNNLEIELVESSAGTLDVKHADDQPEVTEEQLLEQVLDLTSVATVATEFLGENSEVQCSKCDGTLDLSNELGGRLLRCKLCSQITYVDAKWLVHCRDTRAAVESANV